MIALWDYREGAAGRTGGSLVGIVEGQPQGVVWRAGEGRMRGGQHCAFP